MSDRQLLERAAKAEGHGVYFDERSGLTFLDNKATGVLWNPLHNDGDALRLAVKLRLVVEVGRDGTLVYTDDPGICELHEGDPEASTRRAIVRAAAALGEQA